ncbi:MAG: single-stranded DNA-binding protein [Bacteroidales bacterium]
MDGVNRVILLGNLGADPEVKTFDDGNKIIRLSLATNETYKNRNGDKVSSTEWHNVIVRRQGLAEVVEKYLKKGNQIYVEGRIKTRKWQDKEGNNRYTTEILMDNMTMLGGGPKSDVSTASQSEPPQTEEPPIEGNDGDDLPF